MRRKPYRLSRFEEYHDFEFPMTDLFTLRLTYVAGKRYWYGELLKAADKDAPHDILLRDGKDRDPYKLASALLEGGIR